MGNPLQAISRRIIRERPRPTEIFVGKFIAWALVTMALASSAGLIIVAVRVL